MEKIEVKDMYFQYDVNNIIFEDLDLDIEAGEFVCILGPSGCGKSTLLRLLAGLEEVSAGKITIGENHIDGASLNRSVVFQNYGLFPWMTAGENIMIALEQKYPKKNKGELKKIALEYIESVQLNESIFDKFPKELSGGMQQRCAIARSLSINAPILLMDEPFGALDAVTRSTLQDLIIDLFENNSMKRTVFFVTHDVEEAIYLGSRIIVLGQTPSGIIHDYSIAKEYRQNKETLLNSEYARDLRNNLVEKINQNIQQIK